MLNMLNDVSSKNITLAFNAWKECGEIAATALTKLAEQQLGLAGAWVNMGSSQLKLLTEPNGGGELWSRQARLASEYNDLAVDHMRKAVEVVTESTRACFAQCMSMVAQPGKPVATTPKAVPNGRKSTTPSFRREAA
ncbi:MAG: phasin family protein [Gammaproteobacteria bacterium]